MADFIISVMNDYGYIGVFLLIMAENLFPPIPSEAVLSFAGFMTTITDLTAEGVVLSATLGSLCGGILLYFMGMFFNTEKLVSATEKRNGTLVGIKPDHIEKAHKWFCKKGAKTVFLCRFVPVIRSVISVPAGMTRMDFAKFTAYTMAGSGIWNTAIISAGRLAGNKRDVALKIINTFSDTVSIFMAIMVVIFLAEKLWKRGSKKCM